MGSVVDHDGIRLASVKVRIDAETSDHIDLAGTIKHAEPIPVIRTGVSRLDDSDRPRELLNRVLVESAQRRVLGHFAWHDHTFLGMESRRCSGLRGQDRRRCLILYGLEYGREGMSRATHNRRR